MSRIFPATPLPSLRRWLLLLAAATPALSGAPTPLPPGEPLLGPDALAALRLPTDPVPARFDTVAVEGMAFAQAWEVETLRDSSPGWAISTAAPIQRAVAAGDVGIVRFFARSTATTDETGAAYLRVVVQKASGDYANSAEAEPSFRREWQEFIVPFAFDRDFGPGEAQLSLGFGYKRQTLQIGGLEVIYYGRTVPLADLPVTRYSYDGREAGAPWREAAFARIERIRKAGFRVRVVGADGRPAAGATVRVEQRRNAFQFSSAIELARMMSDEPEDRRYRELALELFNSGSSTDELKWPGWIGEWGYSQDKTLAGLRLLAERGFPMRGHVLVWPSWRNLPNAIVALRDTPAQETIPQLALEHIADVAGATRGLVAEWDVVNEPFDNHDLLDLFGRAIMVDWFKAARTAAPEARLYLNDFNNHDQSREALHVQQFEETAQFLLASGAPLGGLGLQMHLGGLPSAPETVLATLDRYERLGLPIRITEFDVKTHDEQIQADATRDYLILAYSHPAVIGFQVWGFWEKSHWYPPAAMFRTDWSERPAAAAYRELVLKQWRTNLAGATDTQGAFDGRGHLGDYRVTVETGGHTVERTFSLSASDTPVEVTVKLE